MNISIIILTTLSLVLGESTSEAAVKKIQPLPKAQPQQHRQDNFIFINIQDNVNRGFYDEAGGDTLGGWTDFGSTACLKSIPYGIHMFHDNQIPFKIIDPDKNKQKSVIVLSGPKREKIFPNKSSKIRINQKLSELYFLHTTMYAESSDEFLPLVRYTIHYQDGSDHVFYCYKGLEIDDWWSPSERMPRAIRTYQEDKIWLINTPWINPLPNIRIDWIEMESTGHAIPVLVALTGARKPGSYNKIMQAINQRIDSLKQGTLRIALVQSGSISEQNLNLLNGEKWCREAKDNGADIVVFPEMYNIGYRGIDFDDPEAVEKWRNLSISRDNEFIIHFRDLAKKLNLAILMTYLESWKGLPRNSASLIDRHGNIVYTYAKVHTCDFLKMESMITPGDAFKVGTLDTRLGPINVGTMICYDRESPESARELMLKGAEIILTPNACTLSAMLIKQFQVRAFENATIVAMANYDQTRFNGHSCVYNADGEEILLAGASQGVYIAEINLAKLQRIRENTIYGNAFRRPHKYSSLISTDVKKPFVRNNAFNEKFNRLER